MITVFIFVGSVFWTILSGFSVYLFTRSNNHEQRIQRIEDVQGSKIDQLEEKLEQFKKEITEKIEVLTGMVHKDKNMENQLNTTLKMILEYMVNNNKK